MSFKFLDYVLKKDASYRTETVLVPNPFFEGSGLLKEVSFYDLDSDQLIMRRYSPVQPHDLKKFEVEETVSDDTGLPVVFAKTMAEIFGD